MKLIVPTFTIIHINAVDIISLLSRLMLYSTQAMEHDYFAKQKAQ